MTIKAPFPYTSQGISYLWGQSKCPQSHRDCPSIPLGFQLLFFLAFILGAWSWPTTWITHSQDYSTVQTGIGQHKPLPKGSGHWAAAFQVLPGAQGTHRSQQPWSTGSASRATAGKPQKPEQPHQDTNTNCQEKGQSCRNEKLHSQIIFCLQWITWSLNIHKGVTDESSVMLEEWREESFSIFWYN